MNASANKQVGVTPDKLWTRPVLILMVLFVLQVAVAAALKFHEADYRAITSSGPLLNFDWNSINRIIITEGKPPSGLPSSITLCKKDGRWVVPARLDFPADARDIDNLISAAKALKRDSPMGTTNDAQDRFKVSEKNFLRCIQFMKDDKLQGSLYVGTAPAFQVLSVRSGDSNSVYSVENSLALDGGNSSSWIDRRLSAVDLSKVMSVDFGTYKLRRQRIDWILTVDGKEHHVSNVTAFMILQLLNRLAVIDLLGVKDDPAYDTSHPILTYSVTGNDSTTASYRFSIPQDGNFVVLKMSSSPFYMKVDKRLVQAIKAITGDGLLKIDSAEKSGHPEAAAAHH
jgi:hypothetical protein